MDFEETNLWAGGLEEDEFVADSVSTLSGGVEVAGSLMFCRSGEVWVKCVDDGDGNLSGWLVYDADGVCSFGWECPECGFPNKEKSACCTECHRVKPL